MASREERMQVLKMVERGLLSAAEGAELLESLSDPPRPEVAPHREASDSPRRMRVLVTDLGTGQQKVDITLPWSLVSVGMSMGARFTPRDIDIDLDEVLGAVRAGTEGKVIEVIDEDEGEQVEIFVD
jgi:hypothetical protein